MTFIDNPIRPCVDPHTTDIIVLEITFIWLVISHDKSTFSCFLPIYK